MKIQLKLARQKHLILVALVLIVQHHRLKTQVATIGFHNLGLFNSASILKAGVFVTATHQKKLYPVQRLGRTT